MRFDATSKLTTALTCHVRDLPERVSRLDEDNRNLRQRITAFQKETLLARAEALSRDSLKSGRVSFVVSVVSDLDPKLATQLGTIVAEQISGVAVLVADNRLLLTVKQDIGLHAGQLARPLSEKLNLKGGGGPTQAQLGGADPNRIDQYKETLAALLKDA